MNSALPLLPICLCGYTANNLNDRERDRENHPTRPLPSGQVTDGTAAALIIGLLSLSLLTIKLCVDASLIFPYVTLLVAMINYNYVVSYFPYLKNIYVAIVGVVPLIILWRNGHGPPPNVPLGAALFLFLLATEMLSDAEDVRGDGRTLVKVLGVHLARNIAFSTKIAADVLLLVSTVNSILYALAVAFACADAGLWLVSSSDVGRRAVVPIAGAQITLGIFFLL